MTGHTEDELTFLRQENERLKLVYDIGIAISAEQATEALLERILLEAKRLCNSDGGTLYLKRDDELHFEIIRSDTLDIDLGGSTSDNNKRPSPIPLFDAVGAPNHNNIVSYAALLKRPVNIEDAYNARSFDFSGTKAFDSARGYRSKSLLALPLIDYQSRVIGVLQLINARDDDGAVISFSKGRQRIAEALASLASVALQKQMLLDAQKNLLNSFIRMIATAIDHKSPYTGAHCERVPEISFMLAQAACDATEGPFKDFSLTEDEWYELRIAAWLHDCGKVTTPVHIMDKATKLELIFDRIEVIAARFEVLKRDAKIRFLEAGSTTEAQKAYEAEVARLDGDLAFLRVINRGGEWLSDEKKARIHQIAQTPITFGGTVTALLTEDEVENLSISRGTLNEKDRLKINGHMVQTLQMLEALPFPEELKQVPEFASGHHERMDGKGYPRGIFAGDMSIPARIMAVADVFEALTAQDRPYKPGKSLSQSIQIMSDMKRKNHLDPDLFNLFVKSGVYRAYGEANLPPELVDEVDEDAALSVAPEPFELPPREERLKRFEGFLPEYESQKKDIFEGF